MVEIKSAKFIKSAAKFEQTREFSAFDQFSFVGRSNVGKSSLINMLTNRKGLAVVGQTPGRTRLINFFEIETQEKKIYLVDLPGYGFAKASKEQQAAWRPLMDAYFAKDARRHVFILMDVRHLPSADDIRLIQYLYAMAVPFSVVANKSDKQSRSQNMKSVKDIAAALKIGEKDILLVSCLKKTGKEEVFNVMKNALTEQCMEEENI
jgi:GTP-binding protein